MLSKPHLTASIIPLLIVYKKVRKLSFTLCIFILSSITVTGQKISRIDSLKNILKEELHDSIRYKHLDRISILYTQSDPDSSLHFATKALELATKNNFLEGQARSQNQLSIYFQNLGDYESALEYLHKSAKIFDALGKPESGIAYYNMSRLYNELKDFSNCLKYALLAKDAFMDTSLEQYIGYVEIGLGEVYTHQKEYDKAKNALLRSKESALEYKDSMLLASSIANSADVAFAERNYRKAKQLQEEVLSLKQVSNDRYGLAEAWIQLAEKSMMLETSYAEIERILNEALAIIEPNDFKTLKADAFELKARLNAKKNDYETAFAYQLRFQEASDSLVMMNNDRNMKLAENKYQARAKQREIDILEQERIIQNLRNDKQQLWLMVLSIGALIILMLAVVFYRRNKQAKQANLTISEQKNTLEKTVQEKEVLVKEIHHRTKNNLYLIESLFDKQLALIKNEEAKKALKEGQGYLEAIRLIHKQMFLADETSLQVDMKSFLIDLSHYYNSVLKDITNPIELTMDNDEVILDVNKAVPVSLAINELISNATKHAFPNREESRYINIEVEIERNDYIFNIRDNGRGYSSTGKEGGGLKLVRGLVKQVGGLLSLKSDNGTQASIKIKIV